MVRKWLEIEQEKEGMTSLRGVVMLPFPFVVVSKAGLQLEQIAGQFGQFRAFTFLQIDMGIEILALHFVDQGAQAI